MTIARDWKYICCLWLSKGAILFPLLQLNVNSYANSIIESSLTLMKFMEVLMNVYLRYSFNCWRKWLYILRKWTAKGVIGSLSNHDDDGNKNPTDLHIQQWKTVFLHALHVHFSSFDSLKTFSFFLRREMTCFAVLWTT